METSTDKTSAELQREIEQDRQRLGNRIDAIQERMSPGQLVDEVLAYARNSEGSEFVGNLGRALKENPLPVALMGVSLAWLMAKGAPSSTTASASTEPEYPLYPVQGPVRRLGPPTSIGGVRYSHFGDGSGQKLKALTDETGRRAGHFVDETGKTYHGFVDASGKQVNQILDETGAMFDAASGWAAEKWEQAKTTAQGLADSAAGAASSLTGRTSSAATDLQDQTAKLNTMILTQFRDQPLVGGALAFAVGAAIGAALPSTETEDELAGEASDAAKEALGAETAELVDRGKAVASDVYERAVEVASEAHDEIKDRVSSEVDALRGGRASSENTTPG
ncbi:nutrient deprivation-induced protein [Rhizobium leguminosarum bv. trifolii]|uniref:Nutrient deprivation-induced protein n=1 Tax=Rhizobium leguminosarum bv. trifolii TaxID=386 RepID=A0A3E1B490_RHILT|nr:DUF3618 domain-containing protein [Rhizobium leguminosarum]RFB85483.1 nutrient deprivation-induced protein [Rhizobium leguminosarum bv. trifolii]RFB85609.1 nutrient deprivation-induced protein [Rhizobium leguminosarum bv. trifolii]